MFVSTKRIVWSIDWLIDFKQEVTFNEQSDLEENNHLSQGLIIFIYFLQILLSTGTKWTIEYALS